eukprot:UN27700
MRIPNFILTHICNIIQPPEEVIPWQILFVKDPKHEEYIRRSMKHRAYGPKDLKGPLMKDAQQKIAEEVDMGDSADFI